MDNYFRVVANAQSDSFMTSDIELFIFGGRLKVRCDRIEFNVREPDRVCGQCFASLP